MIKKIMLLLLLCGCAGVRDVDMSPFQYREISAENYTIAAWEHITDKQSPVHIYIEGDGRAFNASGRPTSDPTPRGTIVREMALRDTNANVVYLARPCQFVMSEKCSVMDWTSGRFSPQIIESMTGAIRNVAQHRPIVLIGYSGGAMISGLVITKHPELNVIKWVTVAGVLNHADWTNYFGDMLLDKSLDMCVLPNVPQVHYVGDKDTVVPMELSKRWVDYDNLIVVPGAEHDNFGAWTYK